HGGGAGDDDEPRTPGDAGLVTRELAHPRSGRHDRELQAAATPHEARDFEEHPSSRRPPAGRRHRPGADARLPAPRYPTTEPPPLPDRRAATVAAAALCIGSPATAPRG